jgi:Phage capsid family
MTNTITRTPVPLVPDFRIVDKNALRSFVRAAVQLSRRTQQNSRNAWPDDKDIDLVLRGSVSPTSTANASALAAIRIALLAALVPTSAAARIIAQSLQLSFDGAYTISIPGLTIPRANWVSEEKGIPVEQGLSSAGALLEPYKLATIIPFTNEMLASSNIEAVLRQMLIESIGPSIDAAMLSNAAGVPGLSPPGLLNGIVPLAASTATGVAAMVADIAAIAEAIAPASGSGTPLIVAAAPQAVSLALLAPREVYPVVMSAALAPGTVVGLVPEGLATVMGLPELALAKHSTLHFDNTPNDDLGGGSTPVRSLFQTDSQALRLIQDASWALRSPSALAWVQNTKW